MDGIGKPQGSGHRCPAQDFRELGASGFEERGVSWGTPDVLRAAGLAGVSSTLFMLAFVLLVC